MQPVVQMQMPVRSHYISDQSGYSAGKNHAYDNVAKTVFFVSTAIVAGVIIYQLGKESRWGANENGIVYRF